MPNYIVCYTTLLKSYIKLHRRMFEVYYDDIIVDL